MALSAADLSFAGVGLEAHFGVPVLPPGSIGQEEYDDSRVDFWIPSVLASALPGPTPLVLQHRYSNHIKYIEVIPISYCHGKIVRIDLYPMNPA